MKMRTKKISLWNIVRALIVVGAMIITAPALSDRRNEITVSLIQLLVTPDKYDQKFVWVIGYLESGPNLNLYLTKDHARVFDHASSIGVHDTTVGGTLTSSSCVGSFVRVRGVFGKLEGLFPAIVDVEEVENLEGRGSCWRRSGRGPNAAGAADKDKVE
jgi:hypothetical protein